MDGRLQGSCYGSDARRRGADEKRTSADEAARRRSFHPGKLVAVSRRFQDLWPQSTCPIGRAALPAEGSCLPPRASSEKLLPPAYCTMRGALAQNSTTAVTQVQ